MTILLLGSSIQALPASAWYSSPDADITGNGSITNPWPLTVALVHTNIAPGDTLYLRSGSYRGPGFISTISGTSNDYVTVRSYPNEWAVLTDNAPVGYLAQDLPASEDKVNAYDIVIKNSETWSVGTFIQIGAERMQLAIRRGNPTNWMLFRHSSAVLAHSSGAEVRTVPDMILNHSGSYVAFRDFEIKSGTVTNRTNVITHVIPGGVNLSAPGQGNKLQGLIVHNVGHPGIGPSKQGDGGEVNGCLIFGNGKYDYLENFRGIPRGSGIYGQNASGRFIIKNCIIFRNFTSGAKVYGETGPVKDSYFIGNIAFDNPLGNLQASSGSTSTSNIWFDANIMLNGGASTRYVSVSNTHLHYINNITVNTSFNTSEHTHSVLTNNTAFVRPGIGTGQNAFQFANTHFAKTNLNIVWDYNTIYLGAEASQYQWAFRSLDVTEARNASGGGYLKFHDDLGKAWTEWTGWDTHSRYTEGWPTDYLNVAIQPLDYDPNRWHIAVVNTTSANNATLDLSSLGFSNGQRYELRDAQNYFSVIATGIYTDGTINLPLRLTSVAAIAGELTHYMNKHTNVDAPGLFNAFVLHRRLIPLPPTRLRLHTPVSGD